MKNITLFVAFLLLGLGSEALLTPALGAPIQEKSQAAKELEEMILNKIKERKKELELEAGKNGGGTDEKSAKSASDVPSTSKGAVGRRPSSKRPVEPAKLTPRSTSPQATPAKPKTGRNLTPNTKIEPVTPATVPTTASTRTPSPSRTEPRKAEYTNPSHINVPAAHRFDPDVRITFSFYQEEWKDVLEWFAEKIGYGLLYGPTGAPGDTMSLVDPNEYTLVEALDMLNENLSHLDPSHVLVRSGKQLILVNESGTIPDVFEIITPEQLQYFSRYEVARCKFELGEVNGDVLSNQLRGLIDEQHEEAFVYVQAANRLVIRERVGKLREIADILSAATPGSGKYAFQHADPEIALATVRQIMGVGETENATVDGFLRFSLSASNDVVYASGAPERVQKFLEICGTIDQPVSGEGVSEKPSYELHVIGDVDAKVVFEVTQTMLDGELNVRMDQDAVTGNLWVYGPERVHNQVIQLLGKMSNSSDTFDIVRVENIKPSDAVDTIEELLGIDVLSEEANNDPRLMAKSENDSVLVYGTPNQRVKIRAMIEELDANERGNGKTRQRVRILKMSPREADNIINYLEIDGVMDSLGRKNRLRIISPKERQRFIDGDRRAVDPQPRGGGGNQGSGARDGSDTRNDSDTGNQNSDGSGNRRPAGFRTTYQPQLKQFYVTTQQQGSAPKTTEKTEQEEINIPNADIQVERIEQGIVITTDDLDAGDDLESLIDDIIDDSDGPEFPTFLPVQFRDANEVKSLLDRILGLSSAGGGGGGGGGIGDLIGGIAENAVGGGAGSALGSLLGGGGGGFSESIAGSVELEGEDVNIFVDGRSNTLIVTGATDGDLRFMVELLELVDIDSPAHRPNLLGKTYVIPVKNRDTMEVKEIIESQLSGYFRTAQNAAANPNQQNPQAAIGAAIANSIGGGRRGARGGAAAQAGGAGGQTSDAPKATLGIDEKNGCLLLTGPESIYEEVVALVQQLDVRQDLQQRSYNATKLSTGALVKMLKDFYGDRIIIEEDSEEPGGAADAGGGGRSTGGRGGATTGRGNTRAGGNNNASSRAELQRNIRNAINAGGGVGGQGGARGGQGGARGGRGR